MSLEAWAYQTYRVIELDEFDERGIAGTTEVIRERVGTKPVYLTFDLDVLDLPWAPAVANPEVGGITARQAIKLLRGLRGEPLEVLRSKCLGELAARAGIRSWPGVDNEVERSLGGSPDAGESGRGERGAEALFSGLCA